MAVCSYALIQDHRSLVATIAFLFQQMEHALRKLANIYVTSCFDSDFYATFFLHAVLFLFFPAFLLSLSFVHLFIANYMQMD